MNPIERQAVLQAAERFGHLLFKAKNTDKKFYQDSLDKVEDWLDQVENFNQELAKDCRMLIDFIQSKVL